MLASRARRVPGLPHATKEQRQAAQAMLDGKARDVTEQKELLDKLHQRNLLQAAIQHMSSQAASLLPVVGARDTLATPRSSGPYTTPRGNPPSRPASLATPRGTPLSARNGGVSGSGSGGGSLTARVQRITSQQREQLKHQASLLGQATLRANDLASVVQLVEGLRLRETALALCDSGRNLELHFLVHFVQLLLEPWRGRLAGQKRVRDEIYQLYTHTNTRVAFPTQLALLDLLVLLWEEPGSPGMLTPPPPPAAHSGRSAEDPAGRRSSSRGRRSPPPQRHASSAGSASDIPHHPHPHPHQQQQQQQQPLTMPPPLTAALDGLLQRRAAAAAAAAASAAAATAAPPRSAPLYGGEDDDGAEEEAELALLHEAGIINSPSALRSHAILDDDQAAAVPSHRRLRVRGGGGGGSEDSAAGVEAAATTSKGQQGQQAPLRHQPSDSARSMGELLAEAKASMAGIGGGSSSAQRKEARAAAKAAKAAKKAAKQQQQQQLHAEEEEAEGEGLEETGCADKAVAGGSGKAHKGQGKRIIRMLRRALSLDKDTHRNALQVAV